MEERIEMTVRQERRCRQSLYDLKKMRGYWKLNEESLDCTLWKTYAGIFFLVEDIPLCLSLK